MSHHSRIAGNMQHATLPSVNKALPSVNKAAHSGFETKRRYHQKSKTGLSVAPQKDLCPLKLNKTLCDSDINIWSDLDINKHTMTSDKLKKT